jgi:hypothetical protein
MADAIYKVQAPDGSILTIQGPEGASPEQIQNVAREQYMAQKAPTDTGGGAATGVFPQMTGRRQLQDTERSANIPQALAESVGAGVLRLPASVGQYFGSDALTKIANSIQAHAGDISYPAVGELGNLGGEMLGTALPVTKAVQLASKIPNALGKSSMFKGAVGAGTAGALTPTAPTEDYGDFASAKAKQIALSMGLGAPTAKASQMFMNPQIPSDLQKLMDLGMTKFTPGQLAGNLPFIGPALREGEKKLTSVPVLGDIIGSGLRESFKDFNKAIGNKALEPLGKTLPKTVEAGEDMIKYIKSTVENSYNDILKRATFRDYWDNKLGTNTVERLSNNATRGMHPLVEAEKKQFERDVFDNIITPIDQNKIMTGAEFRGMEKYLGRQSTKAFESGQEDMGFAYSKLQNALRDELTRQNPAIGKQLEKTHDVFKNLLPLEKASAMRGSQDRVFTPAGFKSGVESTAGRSNVATGMGRFMPESKMASNVLGSNVPDSGTASRTMMANLVLGGGSGYAGGVPLALSSLAGSAMYSPLGMKVMTNLATKRPQMMRKMEPAVSGGLSSLTGTVASTPDLTDLGTINVPAR